MGKGVKADPSYQMKVPTFSSWFLKSSID